MLHLRRIICYIEEEKEPKKCLNDHYGKCYNNNCKYWNKNQESKSDYYKRINIFIEKPWLKIITNSSNTSNTFNTKKVINNIKQVNKKIDNSLTLYEKENEDHACIKNLVNVLKKIISNVKL